MAEQRRSRSPPPAPTDMPRQSPWPQFKVAQRVKPDGSVEITLTSPAPEFAEAPLPAAYPGIRQDVEPSRMAHTLEPAPPPEGYGKAVRSVSEDARELFRTVQGENAQVAQPRPSPDEIVQGEESPLELAHKAGEAFFMPVDTAEVILGQALRRRQRMEGIEERFGLFKSEQVARLSGSEAKNTAQIAHRWQKQGRIFAVPVQGAPRFPGFQFDEHGQPRPVIAQILQTLELSDKAWAVAIWFDTPHASIPGQKSPAEVLAQSPQQALEAAKATHRRAEDWA